MAVTVNAAVYGVAVYGTAIYGKIIVSGLDQVEATGQANTVKVNTAAGIVGVEAVGNIENVAASGFEIDIVERVTTGVASVAAVNTVKVSIAELLDSVDATLTINAEGINVKSFNYVPVAGVQATGYVSVQINTKEPVQSVEATGHVNSITVHTAAGIVGISATGIINDVAISNKIVLRSVVSTGVISSVQISFTKEIVGAFVAASVQQPTIHISEKVTSALMRGHIGSVETAAVQFDFRAVRNLYSRRRTVYIPRAA